MDKLTVETFFARCAGCKGEIAFGTRYYTCSVKSCNSGAHLSRFCSVDCWSLHNEVYNHRDAGAIEEKAPSREKYQQNLEAEKHAAQLAARANPKANPAPAAVEAANDEILVVVSKVKQYINDASGFNSSAALMEKLSDHIRALCDRAIANARADGRKTALDRDLPPLA